MMRTRNLLVAHTKNDRSSPTTVATTEEKSNQKETITTMSHLPIRVDTILGSLDNVRSGLKRRSVSRSPSPEKDGQRNDPLSPASPLADLETTLPSPLPTVSSNQKGKKVRQKVLRNLSSLVKTVSPSKRLIKEDGAARQQQQPLEYGEGRVEQLPNDGRAATGSGREGDDKGRNDLSTGDSENGQSGGMNYLPTALLDLSPRSNLKMSALSPLTTTQQNDNILSVPGKGGEKEKDANVDNDAATVVVSNLSPEYKRRPPLAPPGLTANHQRTEYGGTNSGKPNDRDRLPDPQGELMRQESPTLEVGRKKITPCLTTSRASGSPSSLSLRTSPCAPVTPSPLSSRATANNSVAVPSPPDPQGEIKRQRSIRFADEAGKEMETIYHHQGFPEEEENVDSSPLSQFRVPVRVIILLMDPKTRTFEFVYVYYDAKERTTLGELVRKIRGSATFGPLGKQKYVGVCRPWKKSTMDCDGSSSNSKHDDNSNDDSDQKEDDTGMINNRAAEGREEGGKEMINALATWDYGLQPDEIVIAIPKGLSAPEMAKLAAPLLSDRKLVRLVKRAKRPRVKRSNRTMSAKAKEAVQTITDAKNRADGVHASQPNTHKGSTLKRSIMWLILGITLVGLGVFARFKYEINHHLLFSILEGRERELEVDNLIFSPQHLEDVGAVDWPLASSDMNTDSGLGPDACQSVSMDDFVFAMEINLL